MAKAYQLCTRCIMDTSDPEITFDAAGVCNHCKAYDAAAEKLLLSEKKKKQQLTRLVQQIKKAGKGKDYDCVIGLSGGVDSSYVAYCVKQLGLRPLAVHLDNGWNSELAVKNIENIVKALDIDLYTYVIDWEEFRDLQLAFMKASVVDIEMLTDSAILVVLDRIAKEKSIGYFLSGTNFATENVMPNAWFYALKHDSRNIKAIAEKYSYAKKLRSYPMFSFLDFWRYTFLNSTTTVPILNYLPYTKAEAMQLLKEQVGWRDYGGKHWESKFTRFYQVYILPRKFGIDKRRAHLSSLILSGQLNRSEALALIEEKMYDAHLLEEDLAYVLKKFNLTQLEFDAIMEAEPVPHSHFPSYGASIKKLSKIKQRLLGKKPR